MVINLASFKRLAARETVLLCYVLIIDNAPRTGEVAKKHDKKDRHQSFSDDQRHKLVQLECHSAASRCRTTRVALRFF